MKHLIGPATTEHGTPLTYYQRFESFIAAVLTLVIMVVIVVALYDLILEVGRGLVAGALNPLDHSDFEVVFGQIMTLLIALEFNHTLQYVVAREQSLVQIRIVLLVALLALARKIIILDLKETPFEQMLGLAALALALAIAYWLTRGPSAHPLQES